MNDFHTDVDLFFSLILCLFGANVSFVGFPIMPLWTGAKLRKGFWQAPKRKSKNILHIHTLEKNILCFNNCSIQYLPAYIDLKRSVSALRKNCHQVTPNSNRTNKNVVRYPSESLLSWCSYIVNWKRYRFLVSRQCLGLFFRFTRDTVWASVLLRKVTNVPITDSVNKWYTDNRSRLE